MGKEAFSKGVKRTCNACLGIKHRDRIKCEEGKCPLGYQYDAAKQVPLESCPRPKSYNKLAVVLAEKGIEWPVPENVTVIPARKKD